MTNKSFSEFIRTASDDERRAVYETVMKKATEQQNKLLEEYMEQIETERESFIEGEYIPAGTSERVFSTIQALADYMVIFKVEFGRHGPAYINGQKVFVLQYSPNNQGGN